MLFVDSHRLCKDKLKIKTACTLLPYSILNQIKVDTTYLRTVILTASITMDYNMIIRHALIQSMKA